MEKKILAIIGSEKTIGASKTGNLAGLLIEKITNIHPETSAEIIILGEQNLQFCKGCMKCNKSGQCCINDDMPMILSRMHDADLVILGSPVHISHVSGMYKNFLDRMLVQMHTFGFLGKPFISVVSTNGSGEESTIKYMNHTALLLGMIHQGSLVLIDNEAFNTGKMDNLAWKIADFFSGDVKLKPKLKNSLYFWSMKRIIRRNLPYFEFEDKVWKKRGWYQQSYKEIFKSILN